MAFPQTGVITYLSGADEDPLSEGGLWSGPILGDPGQLKRISGQATSNQANGGYGGSVYATVFSGLILEAYMSITNYVSSRDYFVYLALSGSNGSENGYALRFNTTTATILKYASGTPSTLETITSITIADNDALGLELVTATGALRAYRYSSGWAAIGTGATDSAYTSGKVAFETQAGSAGNPTTIDTLGGGAVVARPLPVRVVGQAVHHAGVR